MRNNHNNFTMMYISFYYYSYLFGFVISDKSLHIERSIFCEARVCAASSAVRVVIVRVTSQMANGAARTKERHATIFHISARLGGNVVLLSQVMTRLDNENQDEYRKSHKHKEAKENECFGPRRILISIIIVSINLGVDDRSGDTLHQNVSCRQNPEELEGCPERLFLQQ